MLVFICMEVLDAVDVLHCVEMAEVNGFFNFEGFWIRQHEGRADDVDDEAPSQELNRIEGYGPVHRSRADVEFQNEQLVGQVSGREVNEANDIEDRHST